MSGFVQDEDADREAGERRHRADDREGDQRGVGLVSGLGQRERCHPADDQRVERPGRGHRAQSVPEGVRERHRQHGDARVGRSRCGGEQQRPGSPAVCQQSGGGDREGDQAGDEHRSGGPSRRRPLSAGVLVRPEHREADADRRHDGDDRRPAPAGKRLPGQHAAQRDADEQRTAEDHLHREQRPGTQRRGVQGEAAGLQRRADQPQRLPGEQGEHPGPAGGLGRCARGLPVFHRDPRSVQHGGQGGEQ